MTLRRKRILGWVLLVPCLLGVLASIGIGEYFLWTMEFDRAWAMHRGLGLFALIFFVMGGFEYHGRLWKHSKSKWRRWLSQHPAAMPLGLGGVLYPFIWVAGPWKVLLIGHAVIAVVAGTIVGIVLLGTKTDA